MTKHQQHDLSLYKKLLDGTEDSPDIVVISEPSSRRNIKRGHGIATRSSCCASAGGCLCKCVLITLAVLTLGTLMTAAGVYLWIEDFVQHLTLTEPKSFPVVEMSEAERDMFQHRVILFFDQLRLSKEPAESLIVTQDEINGFLCGSDYLCGHMQVTLTQDKMLEEYSLPMDMVPGGKGRFFGGHDFTSIDESKQRIELQMETTATHHDWFVGPLYFWQLHFATQETNDFHQRLLALFVENGSIFGNVAGDDYIAQNQNLLEDAYKDPNKGKDLRCIVDGIEHVSLQDGNIVIHPRRRYQKAKNDVPARPVPIGVRSSSSSSSSSASTTTMLRSKRVPPAAPKNVSHAATAKIRDSRKEYT